MIQIHICTLLFVDSLENMLINEHKGLIVTFDLFNNAPFENDFGLVLAKELSFFFVSICIRDGERRVTHKHFFLYVLKIIFTFYKKSLEEHIVLLK